MSYHEPKSGHGSRRVVEVCCVAWIVLLGYGTMLRSAAFDPTDSRTQVAIDRLNLFQQDVAENSSKYSPSVVMNDGAAFYRDLSPGTGEVTYDFLRRVLTLHKQVNARESGAGFPGARTILATGFRVRRLSRRQEALKSGIGSHLVRAVEAGRVPLKQAVFTAVTIRSYFDVIPELQANFAFTKAYLADRVGSRAGFSGPNLFVERCVFSDAIPKWVTISNEISWTTPGISTVFLQLTDLDERTAGRRRYAGINNAFQVAERITTSEGIVSRLRGLTIKRRVPKTPH